MLHGWIIYKEEDAKKNKAFIQRFFQKEATHQIKFELIIREKLCVGLEEDFSILYDGKFYQKPNFIIMRTIDEVLSHFFEAANIPLFNSASISGLANHKFQTHLAMKKLDIPMLKTFYYKSYQLLNTKNFPLPFPFVCKSCSGRGGNEVFLIHTKDDLQTVLESSPSTSWIIQPLAPIIGKDLRVFVVGHSIIGAILRKSNQDFRANYSINQNAEWYTLNDKEKTLINRIIYAHAFGFVGIDFLFDKNGQLIFNEIEDVVGSRTLSIYSDIDAVDLYLQHIRKIVSTEA